MIQIQSEIENEQIDKKPLKESMIVLAEGSMDLTTVKNNIIDINRELEIFERNSKNW